MPGVVGVFTAADLGLEPAPSPFNPTVARTLLASDRVRYVGEPIAAVVAETREPGGRRRRGRDRRLRAARRRRRPGGRADRRDAALRRAPAATSCSTRRRSACPTSPATSSSPTARSRRRGRFVNQRVAPCPLEVRGVGGGVDRRPAAPVGVDAARPGHQGRDRRRQRRRGRTRSASSRPTSAAASAPRSARTPRRSLLGALAKRLGRPVRWHETRSESMMALGHGRAQVQHVTIGGTPRRHGHPLPAARHPGLRRVLRHGRDPRPVHDPADVVGRLRIPNIECRTTSVVTNTTPTVAYRGAGRPEATAAIERAMDLFAAEIGHGPGRGPAHAT